MSSWSALGRGGGGTEDRKGREEGERGGKGEGGEEREGRSGEERKGGEEGEENRGRRGEREDEREAGKERDKRKERRGEGGERLGTEGWKRGRTESKHACRNAVVHILAIPTEAPPSPIAAHLIAKMTTSLQKCNTSVRMSSSSSLMRKQSQTTVYSH